MNQPRVLYLDIETSPLEGWFWGIGHKVSLSYDNITKESKIICICWKWGGEKRIHYADWGTQKQDDRSLLQKFVKVLRQADIVVGHNGDNFDLKIINTRLLYHRLPPAGKLPSEDTLKQLRRTFRLSSNRLDAVGRFLSLGRKLHTDYKLWTAVVKHKDKTAFKHMLSYCAQDVRLLEHIHKTISPYVEHKINAAVVLQRPRIACDACGSLNTKVHDYRAYGQTPSQRRWCKDCGRLFPVPLSKIKEVKK